MKITTKQLKQLIKEELQEVFTPTKLGHYAKRAHKRRGADMEPEDIEKLGGYDRSEPAMAADIDDMYGVEQEPMPDEQTMPLGMMIQDNMNYIVDFEINRVKKWGHYSTKAPDGTTWYSTSATLRSFARRIVQSLDHYIAAQIGQNENVPFSWQEFEGAMRQERKNLIQQAIAKVEKMMQQGKARVGHDPEARMLNPDNNKRVLFIKN